MRFYSRFLSATCALVVASCGTKDNNSANLSDVRPTMIDETTITANPAMRLCRMPDENANAFRKFDSPVEVRTSLESFSVTEGEHVTRIPAPLKSLNFHNRAGALVRNATASGDAQVTYSAWYGAGSEEEFRSVRVDIPFRSDAAEIFTIGTEFYQQRTSSLPHKLLTEKAEIVRIFMGTDYLLYNVVIGDSPCMQDAYQGEQPGTAYGNDTYAGNERTPYTINKKFSPLAGFSVNAQVDGQTSLGGFDKTMTMDIATFTVTGLSATPFVIKGSQGTVHAPAHHNFSEEFLADTKDADLTSEQKTILAQKNIRYFLIRPITEEEREELGLESVHQTSAIDGVSADRQTRTRLSVMKAETEWN